MSSPTPPPGQYGPQGYGPPPQGYDYGPPPKRSSAGLIIGIVIGVIVVLMAIGGLVLVMQGEGGGSAEPQTQPSQGLGQSEGQPTAPAPSTPAADAPRVTAATALAARFVAFMSANKQKEAAALGCADSKQLLPGALMLTVDEQTKLKVSGKTIVEEPGTTAYPMRIDLVPIAGKTRFGPESGFVRIQDIPGQPLCVRIFQLK